MQRKLTITVDEEVYEGLHRVIGHRRISGFIESMVRPHVVRESLDAGYAAIAADEEMGRQALEWVEGTMGDVADEPR